MQKSLEKMPHTLPKYIKDQINENGDVLAVWNSISDIAKNEWICFIDSAKKEDTRQGRIGRLLNDLSKGKKRPCCWAGCPHRVR